MDENPGEYSFGELLTMFIQSRNLTHGEIALRMGKRRATITDWVNGNYLPKSRQDIVELVKILRLDEKDTNRLLKAALFSTAPVPIKNESNSPTTPALLNIPYHRNSYFTGRKQLLRRLQHLLTTQKTIALVQAISGLGGIGKTQTALEYVYRYKEYYQTILWLRADSNETLFSDVLKLAQLLDLPQKENREQEYIVVAVQRWLKEHTHWLLIFDNADDLTLIQDFLPIGAGGHILLTTRNQLVGPLALPITIDIMNSNEGTLFLLRRSGLLKDDKTLAHLSSVLRMQAKKIVDEVDGLPLALEQAGAYMQETGCDLLRYLVIYQEQRASLLKQKSHTSSDYPESVGTAWSLSFQRIQRTNPLAAELLMLCAFLGPDTIPETLFINDVQHLGPTFEPLSDRALLDAAVRDLRRFSLLNRNAETKMLSIHRLVQVVLKDTLDQVNYSQWTDRVIRLMNAVFPESDVSLWTQCQLYLPHVQACAKLIEQGDISSPEALHLLEKAGRYLGDRGLYRDAISLLERKLIKQRHTPNVACAELVKSINDVAMTYMKLAQYPKALLLLQEAVTLSEQSLGLQHPDSAVSLNNLALLHQDLADYTQAEQLYRQALSINEQVLGLEHPEVAINLDNLALLYKMQEKYDHAESLFLRALRIREHIFGPDSLEITYTLTYLGLQYREQGKYAEAETLYLRSLTIRERLLGPEHDDTAQTLNNLAMLNRLQGRYDQAEQFLLRALTIWKNVRGEEHPETATALNNLALVYRDQGRLDEAASFLQQALGILLKVLGEEHYRTMGTSISLGAVYIDQGKYIEAEDLLRHVLSLSEKVEGPHHTMVARSLTALAKLYYLKGEYAEAEPLLLRSLNIWERTQGREHPETINVLFNLARLYQAQERYIAASEAFQHVMSTRKKVLGLEHPDTKIVVESYRALLALMSKPIGG